ncbi:DUF6600 domain-containing protein [Massilia sp.]|uniref:DUF6600 domain-containing protein n=1 Tax=Massilia sp. TaxID=1882437 RepID=UPI002898E49E|nr:DUF6600 domain-containing protein [Massilia sp.]
MNHRFAKTATALALAALSTFAQSQSTLSTEDVDGMALQTGDAASQEAEAPGRVGRVSLVEGKVTISGDVGDASSDALLNWPVTTRNLITTAPGARAELRIGSTAVRLDADSSLEITELDDDSMRLRLHYGSASVRVANAEVASEFELHTMQARVTLQGPGRLRVDAEKVADTSLVSVFDGAATVDGAGASLTVRAGRSAEVRDEDVRTLQAQRDAFDDWSLSRDSVGDNSRTARYVTTEMTGYEDLDRHGSWSEDAEYGSLWTPTVVAGWTPYRDGQWTWIAPWGWTWVDNAPWGYAPFHYGRWVQVNRRWAWAPGRHVRRPVWAPALVGWVGGSNWNVGFQGHGVHRPLPATGWYPLGPRDRFVPGYRLSQERLQRINAWRNDKGHDEGRDRDRDGRPDFRRAGLTVVPNGHFGGRAPVVVSNLPRANGNALTAPGAPGVAPPPPQGWRDRNTRNRVEILRPGSDSTAVRGRDAWERDRDRIDRNRPDRGRENFDPDRFNRERAQRDRFNDERNERFERGQRERQPQLSTENPVSTFQPGRITPGVQPGLIGTAPQAGWQRPERDAQREQWRDRGGDRGMRPERGERNDYRPRPQAQAAMPAPTLQAAPPAPAPDRSPPPVRQFTPAPNVGAAPSRGPGRPDSPRSMRGGRSDMQDSR